MEQDKKRRKKMKQGWITVMNTVSALIAVFDTIMLFMIRESVSYEVINGFKPIQKSSIFTILEHSTIIKYSFILSLCIMILCAFLQFVTTGKYKK